MRLRFAKSWGIRTLFNVLGPLTNPAGASLQLLGVFHADLVEPLAQVLGDLGSKRAWVVHGRDGLDEITVTDNTLVAEWRGGKLHSFEISPRDLGLELRRPEQLGGGGPEQNATLMRALLQGQGPEAIEDAVCLNAAAGLVIADLCPDLESGLQRSRRAIQEGAPLGVLESLVRASQGEASQP